MTRLKNSNKGFGFAEILMLLIGLFLFGVLSVVAYRVFDDLNTDIQADSSISADAKADVNDLYDRFPETFDGAFITILGLLFIAGIVASMFSDTHPAIIIVVIVLMVFVSLAAGYLSNTWEEFISDDSFTGFSEAFPMTNWVLDNYLVVIAVSTIVFGGITFFKQRNG